jgi:EAL domain-containing protein (putative c-di-GMP-specific phosphodiesterase class I)/GGDEF domain-containing protein
MSLFRQLWLGVILVTLTSFAGSLAISLHSTKSYLEQQLHRKNIDNANSLAYSISQLAKDPVTIGLQIAALFDTGQYETISITSPDGKVIAEKVRDQVETNVPKWFMRLFSISPEAGQAQISDTLLHFGVIKVVGQTQVAYETLWDEAKTLVLWFLATATVCALIGLLILLRINKPLREMVQQAEAITERHFLTISEPRIPELRSLARATNDMVRRLHNRRIEETVRMETLHKQMNFDPVTGLAKREYFMNKLSQILSPAEGDSYEAPGIDGADTAYATPAEAVKEITPGENQQPSMLIAETGAAPAEDGSATAPVQIHGESDLSAASLAGNELAATNETKPSAPVVATAKPQYGILFLIRINNLEEINRELGRIAANNLLHEVGMRIAEITAESVNLEEEEPPAPLAARLNGSDFVLLVPDAEDATNIAVQLTREFRELRSKNAGKMADFCHIGAVRYERGDTLSELLGRADAALATAEQIGANAWHAPLERRPYTETPTLNISDWRHIFSDALAANRFKLVLYPVISHTGTVLHQEAVARMQAQPDGGWLDAGDFVNIAARLNLTGPVDLTTVNHALEFLRENNTEELAINLSIETVADWDFHNRIEELLTQHAGLCSRLWMEVPEYGAFRKFEVFRNFCHTFKKLGCHIGIEDFGRHFDETQNLAGLGLDYIKVDASFVRGINQNKGNQKFLKGLCKLAHNMNIIMMALGVKSEAERKALIKIGFDGFTGPGIK